MNTKSLYILGGIIILLVCVAVLFLFGPKLPWNQRKAQKKAEEYVLQKYKIELKANSIVSDLRIVDGGRYTVSFKDKNDLGFQVYEDFRFDRCMDNYEYKLFSSEFMHQYGEGLKKLWYDNISLDIYPQIINRSEENISFEDGTFDFIRYEKEAHYTIYLNLPEDKDRKKYAECTFNTIKYIKNVGLNAESLYVRFVDQNGNIIKGKPGSGFPMNKEYNNVDDVKKEL